MSSNYRWVSLKCRLWMPRLSLSFACLQETPLSKNWSNSRILSDLMRSWYSYSCRRRLKRMRAAERPQQARLEWSFGGRASKPDARKECASLLKLRPPFLQVRRKWNQGQLWAPPLDPRMVSQHPRDVSAFVERRSTRKRNPEPKAHALNPDERLNGNLRCAQGSEFCKSLDFGERVDSVKVSGLARSPARLNG